MTPQEQWSAVDGFLSGLLVPPDAMLDAALAASEAAGLPQIQVSPNQGKLLYLLARTRGVCDVLDIGTLGGYSTLWLARALPPGGAGRVVTLEANPKHAEIARANFARAGLADTIDLRVGPALETLPQLAAEAARFDFVFIDADKASTADYFDGAVRLSRPGAVIVIDNVVRDGDVLDAASEDPSVRGIRGFLEALAADPRVTATAVQTVGSKGYDGFAMAVVERGR